MRFILNFVFFGILFYLIWMFFPEAFTTLVSWANHVVVFLRELAFAAWDKVHHAMPPPEKSVPVAPAFLLPLLWYVKG